MYTTNDIHTDSQIYLEIEFSMESKRIERWKDQESIARQSCPFYGIIAAALHLKGEKIEMKMETTFE